jgi:hypothetical protein
MQWCATAFVSPRPSDDSFDEARHPHNRRRLEKSVSSHSARITIALTAALAGALAVLTFSAATAHACGTAGNGFADCPDLPTNIDFNLNTIGVYELYNPLFYQQTETTNLDFSVLNAPDQTFEGTVLYRLGEYGGENYNLSVTEDISGNVPLGEQYNDFTFYDVLGEWGEVYNDIGVTPEAFLITPFGDIDFPTAFVEAVGPTFFEPWASVGLS